MNKLQRKIVAVSGSLAVLAAQAAPVFASTNLVLTGNGSNSESAIEMQNTSTTTVVQENNTQVDNKIKVTADTGNNTASDNTGGNVYVETGDSNVGVAIENVANSNVANVEQCGGCMGDTNIVIDGNGTQTENYVGLKKASATALFQENKADFDNDVNVDAYTGANKVDDNTGADNVTVVTGDASVGIAVHNMANSNTASVQGGADGNDSGVNLWIKGNGSHSKNAMELELENATLLSQYNDTDIRNKLRVDADTGYNTVSDSTGGMVGIGTGDANVYAHVDNAAGFNTANIDDCCADGVFAKIGENGTDTENYIGASLDTALDVYQENTCGQHGYDLFSFMFRKSQPCFDNDLELEAYTGDNEADDNTGDADADPLVITGDSNVGVSVGNTGGSNAFGSTTNNGFEWPGLNHGNHGGIGLNLEISLDFSDLWDLILGS